MEPHCAASSAVQRVSPPRAKTRQEFELSLQMNRSKSRIAGVAGLVDSSQYVPHDFSEASDYVNTIELVVKALGEVVFGRPLPDTRLAATLVLQAKTTPDSTPLSASPLVNSRPADQDAFVVDLRAQINDLQQQVTTHQPEDPSRESSSSPSGAADGSGNVPASSVLPSDPERVHELKSEIVQLKTQILSLLDQSDSSLSPAVRVSADSTASVATHGSAAGNPSTSDSAYAIPEFVPQVIQIRVDTLAALLKAKLKGYICKRCQPLNVRIQGLQNELVRSRAEFDRSQAALRKAEANRSKAQSHAADIEDEIGVTQRRYHTSAAERDVALQSLKLAEETLQARLKVLQTLRNAHTLPKDAQKKLVGDLSKQAARNTAQSAAIQSLNTERESLATRLKTTCEHLVYHPNEPPLTECLLVQRRVYTAISAYIAIYGSQGTLIVRPVIEVYMCQLFYACKLF